MADQSMKASDEDMRRKLQSRRWKFARKNLLACLALSLLLSILKVGPFSHARTHAQTQKGSFLKSAFAESRQLLADKPRCPVTQGYMENPPSTPTPPNILPLPFPLVHPSMLLKISFFSLIDAPEKLAKAERVGMGTVRRKSVLFGSLSWIFRRSALALTIPFLSFSPLFVYLSLPFACFKHSPKELRSWEGQEGRKRQGDWEREGRNDGS